MHEMTKRIRSAYSGKVDPEILDAAIAEMEKKGKSKLGYFGGSLTANEFSDIRLKLEEARLSRKVDLGTAIRRGEQLAETTTTALLNKTGPGFGLPESSDSELSENIPTAAFRAVTEPQANQMLLIMSQQVSHLQQIEMNTSVLPAMADSIVGAAGGSSPFHTYSVPLAARNGGA